MQEVEQFEEQDEDVTETSSIPTVKYIDKNGKTKYFDYTRHYVDVDGDQKQTGTTFRFVRRDHYDLLAHLRDITEVNSLYGNKPTLIGHDMIGYLTVLRDYDYEMCNGFKEFVEFFEKEFEDQVSQIDDMIKNGVVSFECVGFMFTKGDKIYFEDENNQLIAGEISSFSYSTTWYGSKFDVTYMYVDSNGGNFEVCEDTVTIGDFKGTKPIDDLPVRQLTDDIEKVLVKRGKLYREVGLGSTYMHYNENLRWKTWMGTRQYKARGRVMIDIHNFGRVNPDYGRYDRRGGQELKEFTDNKLYMATPYIRGFSFTAKKWGEIMISELSEIKFDSDAYEQLVLDASRKKLVKALVENSSGTFNDIISGKGGGCIFLLHGPPGTGKTLTAESIAELLERPLYSVSVGELGITPDHLEETLREILDMATEWDAVILIDEADIFLEARDENDIQRNAMVGIFLRLLEYHQGVLFLTTNRVKTFDEAFYSRISVSLEYSGHNEESRSHIWRNLLKAAKIDIGEETISVLATKELNGRQIKNVIRLSEALATSESASLTLDHFLNTIEITGQFQESQIAKLKDKEA